MIISLEYFLLREDESQQLLIPKNLIDRAINGDIVEIHKEIVPLREETKQIKDKVSNY